MIGYVRGQLAAKQAPTVTVEAGGIGYDIETPMSTFLQLPGIGAEITLLTHFLVRDDAQLLYGFSSADERQLFRDLLKVTGVGARIALALLSGMSVAAFRQCLEHDDVTALTRVPGIGRKTAQRLLVEMRDRPSAQLGAASPEEAAAAASDGRADAFHALLALGYRDAEVRRLLAEVAEHDTPQGAEDYIRLALRRVAG